MSQEIWNIVFRLIFTFIIGADLSIRAWKRRSIKRLAVPLALCGVACLSIAVIYLLVVVGIITTDDYRTYTSVASILLFLGLYYIARNL